MTVMTSRREFLHTSAVMSALAMHGLVPRGAQAAIQSRAAGTVLHTAVYDERYAECRAFGATADALGAAVRPIERGDVTAVYDELDVAWRTAPASVAGTTQFGPMFVLERLARERGMRVVLRAEHRPSADGTIRHVISAPAATLTLAAELCGAGIEWPAVMAALACRAAGAPLASVTLQSRAAAPALAHDAAAPGPVHYYVPQRLQQGHEPALDGPLYSWLVAPIPGAGDAGTA